MIGVKSLERMVVIMLPASMSQPKMEIENQGIIDKYLSQFVF